MTITLLLFLWQNINIQFVSESSLALANYVTDYVTKAEKSHMQEIFDCTDNAQSNFSRLFSFGVRSLRSRERGMYEASDILLGDHLLEKSDTVQWVAVDQPHKQKRRLKNHEKLKALADNDPDSTNVFESNLIDNFYPNRPFDLENMCLYDFLKWYTYSGTDSSGNRTYKNYPSHVFQIIVFMILARRTTFILYCCYLFHLEMKVTWLRRIRLQKMHLNQFITSNSDIVEHHEKLCKFCKPRRRVLKGRYR